MRVHIIAAACACFGVTVLSCNEAPQAGPSDLFSGLCLKNSQMSVSIAGASSDSTDTAAASPPLELAARSVDAATTKAGSSSSDSTTQTITATLLLKAAAASSSPAYGGLLIDTSFPKTETPTTAIFTDDKGATKPPLGASTTSKSGALALEGGPPAFGMVRLGLVTLGMTIMTVIFAEL